MLIGDILDVFRKGKSVANPELWKNVGLTAGAVSGFATSALAVAAAFGYRIDVGADTLDALAYGVAGLLSIFAGGLHWTTSDKVGLPARPADTGSVPDGSNSVGADPAAVSEFIRRAGNSDADRM